MKKKIGRYSKYLRPLTVLFDLSVVNIAFYFFFLSSSLSLLDFFVTTSFWIISSFVTSFYEVYRFTKSIQIADKVIKQFALFALFTYAYIGIFSKNIIHLNCLKYLLVCLVVIVCVKLSIFYSLKIFRKYYNGNQRRVIAIGNDTLTNQLVKFFNSEKDYGYDLVKHFKNEPVKDILTFCKNESIDEVYLSLEQTTNLELNKYINFVDDNFRILKYIPRNTDLASNNIKFDYYGIIPVIPLRKFPLQKPINKFIKRSFDIVVSTLVIILILSWLVPLIGILIKIESKGPIFFNQKRNGLFYKEFLCFKFRSMYTQNQTDCLQATKNDKRITKVGKFLRKSSLDEMPQFFNVLFGDMSVCGPRPHPLSMTHEYQKRVHKFKLRHYIKPGITGMAQTHGYRGEIEEERDIINRVKYDIFYLENWSLLLDIKIIYLTVKNAVLGDKKAY